MIYKVDKSQRLHRLVEKEKREQVANVWGTRPSVCQTQKPVWFSFNLAMSKDARSLLFPSSSFSFLFVSFLFPRNPDSLPALRKLIISTIEQLLVIHFPSSLIRKTQKAWVCDAWQPPGLSRVGELYVEASAPSDRSVVTLDDPPALSLHFKGNTSSVVFVTSSLPLFESVLACRVFKI